jgi:hypothetical protein
MMKHCRECRREISDQAAVCPHRGAPFPAREKWDGWGYEFKSRATVLTWRHIAERSSAGNSMRIVEFFDESMRCLV